MSGTRASTRAAAGTANTAPMPQLSALPTLCTFDVTLKKSSDGSLGINVRESSLLSSNKTVTRIVGYKPVNTTAGNAGDVGPAEALGFVQESDIIVGVGNEDLLGEPFSKIVAKIKAAPPDAVRLRLLRPNPCATLTGVAPAATYLGAAATGFVAVVHNGLGQLYTFGTFPTPEAAAMTFDRVVLSVYGTRAAKYTNFSGFLAYPILRAEISASTIAATGDIDGARALLQSTGAYEKFSYTGFGRFHADGVLNAEHSFVMQRAETEAEALNRHSYGRQRPDVAPGIALLGERNWTAGQWSHESHNAVTIAAPNTNIWRDGDDGEGHADVPQQAWYKNADEVWSQAVSTQFSAIGIDAATISDDGWVLSTAMLSTPYSVANLNVSGAPLLDCLVPPLRSPPFGPSHGFSYQDTLPRMGVGDDLICSPPQKVGRLRDADANVQRFRTITTTLLAKTSPDGSTIASKVDARFPLALHSQKLSADQAADLMLQPSESNLLRTVLGGPGTQHKLFNGVHFPVRHEQTGGMFAVSSLSHQRNAIIGYFPTAVQAALAHDRFAKRAVRLGGLPAIQLTGVLNFDGSAMFATALTTAVWNSLAQRPELFLLAKEHHGAGQALLAAWRGLGNPLLKDAMLMVHPSVVSENPENAAKEMLAGLGLSVDMAKLAERAVVEDAAPIQVPDEYVPFLEPFNFTGTQVTDPNISLRVIVSVPQRTMLKNQILVMKALMKYQLPAPAVVNEATNIDLITKKAGRATATPQAVSMAAKSRVGVSPAQSKRGSYRGRKKRRSKRDSDDDDDDEDDVDEDSNWRKAKPSGEASVRRSARPQSTKRSYARDDDDDDDDAEDDEEVDEEEDDGAKQRGRKKKSAQKPTMPSKLTIGALDDDDDEGGMTWRVEKILAVRYADLPDDPDDPLDEVAKLPANATEEAKAQAHDKNQLRRLLALPIQQRRDWQALEYLVRWKGLSYLHVEWVAASLVKEQGVWGVKRAKNFLTTDDARRQLDDEEERLTAGRDPLPTEAYFEEDYIVVERILGSKEVESDDPSKPGKRTMYLVKWRGLPYAECTWEWEDDIKDDKKVAQFHRFNAVPRIEDVAVRYDSMGRDLRPDPREWKPYKESPLFKAERSLRDYQLEGLNWLVFNWYNHRNSILADEMGLGKTVQTVALLEHLRNRESVRGPFLVLAPLSTLGHWKREFDEWTDMNAVYYHDPLGGAEARQLIREFEWTYPGPKGEKLASQGVYKFNALVTSYHVLLSDWDFFEKIRWRYVVVDEAHALKNRDSQLKQALRSMSYDSLLLLTGTPLQNDVVELWSLLELIRPDRYHSLEQFVAEYGELKDSSQVAKLQKELTPIMLRRAKEDVEKSIPPKEETLINVELTRLQKAYYRAVFDRNRGFLSRGAANTSVANLVNIEMELRKCCNHPYLLRGAEQRENSEGVDKAQRIENMVAASGKMVLLDKLLPKLHEEGHRVLIFSQFKMMLGLIEDLLNARHYKYERLDGSIRGNERQAAIDRFNKPGSDIFAFLLSTKAGGQGINLTAADTVIIFDSDWNPQNDVQAMARAHRIGQTKDVRIYRLITSKTYEAEMFKRASRKLGLSQAVFESGGVGKRFDPSSTGDEEAGDSLSGLLTMDKDKVEALLRFGAYAIMDDEEANDAAAKFQASSIDQILSKSATIRYDEGAVKAAEMGEDAEGDVAGPDAGQRKGLNLSKATFAVDEGDSKLDVSDPSFWEKVLGPKPAELLSRDLQAVPSVLEDPVRLSQWVADFTALLDDVFEARTNGDGHESADAVQAVLLELQVLGKRFPHPLSPAGRSRWLNANAGATWTFPSPSPAITSTCMASTVAAAHARSRAAAGRGSVPEQDGDGKQHDGTMADLAVYWIDRLEQGRRARKRGGRAAVNYAPPPTTPHTPGGTSRPRGRPRTRPRPEDFENGDVEMNENGELVPVSGRKRARGLKDNVGAGERDVDEENGLPSISNIRIRITPIGPGSTPVVVPLGPESGQSYNRPSKWLETHAEYAPEGRPEEPTGVDPAAQTITMPGDLFDKTGFTRAQVLAASAAGSSVEDYAEKERSGTLMDDETADEETRPQAVIVDGIDRTKRVARWHLAYNRSTSQAAAQVFPAPESLPTGDVKFVMKPVRVVAVFTSAKGITLKPRDAKGPKGFVPNWVLAGMPVDPVEEEKRVARKSQWAKKNQERQQERAEAKRAAALAAAESGGKDAASAGDEEEEEEEEEEEDEMSGMDEEDSEDFEDEDDERTPAAKKPRLSNKA